MHINMDMRRIVTSRHFANKLWNATRFCLSHIHPTVQSLGPSTIGQYPSGLGVEGLPLVSDEFSLELPDQWILTKLVSTIEEYERGMHSFHMGDAANSVSIGTMLVSSQLTCGLNRSSPLCIMISVMCTLNGANTICMERTPRQKALLIGAECAVCWASAWTHRFGYCTRSCLL